MDSSLARGLVFVDAPANRGGVDQQGRSSVQSMEGAPTTMRREISP